MSKDNRVNKGCAQESRMNDDSHLCHEHIQSVPHNIMLTSLTEKTEGEGCGARGGKEGGEVGGKSRGGSISVHCDSILPVMVCRDGDRCCLSADRHSLPVFSHMVEFPCRWKLVRGRIKQGEKSLQSKYHSLSASSQIIEYPTGLWSGV